MVIFPWREGLVECYASANTNCL